MIVAMMGFSLLKEGRVPLAFHTRPSLRSMPLPSSGDAIGGINPASEKTSLA